MFQEKYNIGTHVNLQLDISSTIARLPAHLPYQILFGSNKAIHKGINQKELADTLECIGKQDLQIYVHSAFTINLCNSAEEKDGYYLECLSNNLKYAQLMSMKGVVVHVGKAKTLSFKKALGNMKSNIKRCLESATRDCPLLLETPAAQGTEILTTMETFIQFIQEIDDPRLGICLDTCHVFAAGIMPSEYISKLISENLKPKLIHFNDSQTDYGSKKDRHADIGKGKIDIEELHKCAQLAQKYNIPMIQEYTSHNS